MKKIKKTTVAVMLSFGSMVCMAQELTVCTSTSYTVPSAVGVSGATYKWLENGAEVSGAAGESYTNLAGKPAGTYVYIRRAFTGACGWQNSNAFIVYVTGSVDAPAITEPADGCVGADYVFTVPVAGGTTYEWSGGGTPNGNSYTYSNATDGVKTVTVRAVTAACSSAPASASVTVYAKPEISVHPASTSTCSTATLSVTASPVTAYRWLKNDVATSEGTGYTTADYTTAALTSGATYSVVVANGACSITSNTAVVSMKTDGCSTAPGATVNFTAFNPSSTAEIGSVWYLADTRESSNPQTYTVKKMADGRIWMVQDMKFGNLCNKTTFSGSNGSDQTGKISNASGYTGYYGDCRSYTLSGVGYYYDWAAATQQSGAYSGGSYGGCSGSTGGLCQGICPAGWHVPSASPGEF